MHGKERILEYENSHKILERKNILFEIKNIYLIKLMEIRYCRRKKNKWTWRHDNRSFQKYLTEIQWTNICLMKYLNERGKRRIQGDSREEVH